MWVKDTSLHFIIDSDIHNNFFLEEVVKRLALLKMSHLHPYTIGWLCQGSDLCISQQC
jgi:hypothetical protein